MGLGELITYFGHASMVVKLVMLILIGASVLSWTFIFQHRRLLKQFDQANSMFERQFWSGGDLITLYNKHATNKNIGLARVFSSGFEEFLRREKNNSLQSDANWINSVQRAMRIAYAYDKKQFEKHLTFLATVGSTSPYIGLFGTVWGIMMALQAMGHSNYMTIAMVAPGISEALIATAIGLFAAIPAVIAYNHYSEHVAQIDHTYSTFQEEFSSILLNYFHQKKLAVS